jgi:glycosyltransferase involved in cell wall biosynthesis
VIAGSEHLLGAHRGLFEDAHQRVIRLPLAPLDGARPAPPASPPARLGYIGALTEAKGVGLLLEAAPTLAAAGLAVEIAGEGALAEKVESAPVAYAGRVDGQRKLEFLRSCDLGIVPSLWEEPSGPPYVVCEWLAAGRPVLVSRRGGLAEAAAAAGVVAFEESAAGIAEAVGGLRDPARWGELVASVPRVEDASDVDRWLDQHEETYRAALAGASARAPA